MQTRSQHFERSGRDHGPDPPKATNLPVQSAAYCDREKNDAISYNEPSVVIVGALLENVAYDTDHSHHHLTPTP